MPALPAFTDDWRGRRDELAAILVTRCAAPRRGASNPSPCIDREQRRTAVAPTPHAYTGRHIAYDDLGADPARNALGGATLFDRRRNERGDVFASPRTWKNDFR
ncbi:MAG: hypothetical protein JO090_07025 [Rhizobacter sp.]|nr:hypothetical protein [Rhizobacter sp.]